MFPSSLYSSFFLCEISILNLDTLLEILVSGTLSQHCRVTFTSQYIKKFVISSVLEFELFQEFWSLNRVGAKMTFGLIFWCRS